MTPAVLVVFEAVFVVGVVLGYLLRRALEPTSYTPAGERATMDTMPTRILRATVQAVGRPAVTTSILVVVVLASAFSGFLNVSTASKVESVVECQTAYNREAGEARDERDDAARDSTRSELRLWRDLRAQFSRPGGVDEIALGNVLASIDQRIEKLEALRSTRASNPYPDPDTCEDSTP